MITLLMEGSKLLIIPVSYKCKNSFSSGDVGTIKHLSTYKADFEDNVAKRNNSKAYVRWPYSSLIIGNEGS